MGGGGSKAAVSAPTPKPEPEEAKPPELDKRLPFQQFRDLYLKANPANVSRYPKLSKIEIDSIGPDCEDKGFETMADLYLKVFDDVIAVVEESPADASTAITRLNAVGKKHRPFGLKYDDFQKLEEPFLSMVGELLGDRYTDKAENLFRKFFQFCLRYIVEGFQP
uniref:Globin family profile domain-containing protein n=1 Tax=Panagrolaimus sp. ES5 TaxID=591445 RepID=A0AC34GCZ1_9BILA